VSELVVAVLVAGLVAGGVVTALAATVRRGQRRANQVVPGVDSPAPSSWAGAHTPEARLHRRLRDAMGALRAIAATDPLAFEGLADVDRYALRLDQRLVAVAAVPESTRAPALAQVTADVEALEAAVGTLADQVAAGSPGIDGAVQALSQRLTQLAEARAEVEALDPPDPLRPGD